MITPTGLLATAIIAFAVLNTVTARAITGEGQTEILEAADTQQVVEHDRLIPWSQSTVTTCDKNGKNCKTTVKQCCNGKCKTYKNVKKEKVLKCPGQQ